MVVVLAAPQASAFLIKAKQIDAKAEWKWDSESESSLSQGTTLQQSIGSEVYESIEKESREKQKQGHQN